MEVEIRSVRVDDAKESVLYFRKLASECKYTLMEPEDIEVNRDSIEREKNFLKEIINNPNSLYLIVGHRGQIVGQITVTKHKQIKTRHAATCGISLRKDFRCMGLGTFLMDKAIQWCKENEVLKLESSLFSTNKVAQNLFRKFGFGVEGVLKRHINYKGKYIDYLQMGRWL